MSKMKRGLGSWFKVLAYPLVRPAQDIKSSLGNIKAAAEAAREQREANAQAGHALDEVLKGRSPQEKFEATFEATGWSEQDLALQLLAARRARIASLVTSVVGFFAVLLVMWNVSGWVLILLGAAAVALVITGVLQCVRYAWWEYSLESRTLTPLRAFFSRPDLIRRMCRL